ncbi:flagellar protein FlaG [Dechloromonas denitrificans]|nr:flagellar protein FlaG [Dechloromonas denitrificans]
MSISSLGMSPSAVAPPLTSPSDNSVTSGKGLQAAATSSGTQQPVAGQTKKEEPSSKDLQDAVKSMNDFVGTINNSLKFSVDDETGKTIVKVMDVDTKEVIKQIPSEEMIAIAKAVDQLKGLLVQQKA